MLKRSCLAKRRSNTLSALGVAGVSLSMASGAWASTSEASAKTSPPSQKHELILGEEEISDVSLATFYIFDRENAGALALLQRRRLALGGCGGCGGAGCGGSGGDGGGSRCAYSSPPSQPSQPPEATQPTRHRRR
jgi:hypothetical protein